MLRVALLLVCTVIAAGASSARCVDDSIAVQILGSGGPIPDDARAGSGYLVWVDGEARVMVDAGGGVFLRYGEAQAQVSDLDLVALTHFHIDHTVDVPAILKGGFFAGRKSPLPVAGPSGAEYFPGTKEFFEGLFDAKRGIYRYFSGFLDGSRGLFRLDPIEVFVTAKEPTSVLDNEQIQVSAIGVTHGPVPALGYLVTAGTKRIAFSGDQNTEDSGFGKMISGADILVMHNAIPQDGGPVERRLHATPEQIGRLAADARVKKLVLSHFMARSLAVMDDNLARIREHYKGKVVLAEDLMCVSP